MNIKEIGEFGFIDHFRPRFDDIVCKSALGIGDDCAVISANDQTDWLVTTDMLVEEIHFLRNDITPFELGYKSAAVNISDVAAMGGKPFCSFLSIAIPLDCSVEYLDEFMRGYHAICKKYNVALLGGDTTKSSKHLTINVAVIGSIAHGKAKLRSAAHRGDLICTTGFLGDSAGGLQLVLAGKKDASRLEKKYLLERHYVPEPRVDEGMFLANFSGVHAMMDISDGIASDLRHILEQTKNIDAEIDIEKIPISFQLLAEAQKNKWNAVELATSGGEDYELLFTLAKSDFAEISLAYQKQFKKPLYCIGKVTETQDSNSLIGKIRWRKSGEAVEYQKDGFNHFAS